MNGKNLTDSEFVDRYKSIEEKSGNIKDFGFIIFFYEFTVR